MDPALRLAVLRDFDEERWPSMDLVADMLLAGLAGMGGDAVRATEVRPRFRRRAARVPGVGRTGAGRNVDRLVNRLWDYPRDARRLAASGAFDFYHVVDHSYSQLLHALPAGRAGVQCHDLDTFRCLLDPAAEPRPRWFRAMARHVLRGMQRAAVVFYESDSTRRQIEAHGLIDPQRLVKAVLGVAPEFVAEVGDGPGGSRAETGHIVEPLLDGRPFVLHVGSCIPRKRIDVLLDVFAEVRRTRADLRLVQIGGEWTEPQREQIRRLGIGPAVTQARGLARSQIAALYRAGRVVLQPSDAEGFGLPVIEALACGAAVVASDLPVLREVGGPAALYRPVGDVAAWADAVGRVLDDPAAAAPARAARLAWAAQFSWRRHAEIIVRTYRRLA